MAFGSRIALAAAPALLASGCATTAPSSPPSLIAGADPDAQFEGGELWVYPTGETERLMAWSSADRATFVPRGVLIRQSDIGWIRDDGARRHHLWAPDVVRANGRYYLYYSVGPQNPTPSRIGVAVGSSPAGPFTDSGRPLLTGGDGFEAIDPMVFADPKDGRHYLLAGGSAGAKLRIFRLTPDLLRIEREMAIEQPRNFTEAPFMHVRGGVYYLSYSAGEWHSASYAVHYSTASLPTGPWLYRGAILSSDALYKGPGHHAFARDPTSGTWLVVYHRWEGKRGGGPYRGHRQVRIETIAYGADGAILPIRMTPGSGSR